MNVSVYRARTYLAQLAPHVREREGARVLADLLETHERALAVVGAAVELLDAIRCPGEEAAAKRMDEALCRYLRGKQ